MTISVITDAFVADMVIARMWRFTSDITKLTSRPVITDVVAQPSLMWSFGAETASVITGLVITAVAMRSSLT